MTLSCAVNFKFFCAKTHNSHLKFCRNIFLLQIFNSHFTAIKIFLSFLCHFRHCFNNMKLLFFQMITTCLFSFSCKQFCLSFSQFIFFSLMHCTAQCVFGEFIFCVLHTETSKLNMMSVLSMKCAFDEIFVERSFTISFIFLMSLI